MTSVNKTLLNTVIALVAIVAGSIIIITGQSVEGMAVITAGFAYGGGVVNGAGNPVKPPNGNGN